MPILVMSVCPGSSVFSLFVPVVALQNHTTSYSLNQYSICLSPERKQKLQMMCGTKYGGEMWIYY